MCKEKLNTLFFCYTCTSSVCIHGYTYIPQTLTNLLLVHAQIILHDQTGFLV